MRRSRIVQVSGNGVSALTCYRRVRPKADSPRFPNGTLAFPKRIELRDGLSRPKWRDVGQTRRPIPQLAAGATAMYLIDLNTVSIWVETL